MEFENKGKVYIKRSNRKSMSIEIRPDLSILVRAPFRMPEREIMRYLEEKKEWVDKHLVLVEEKARARGDQEPLSLEDLNKLADRMMEILPDKVSFYAEKMGVTYGRITIRNQKTRWGSCSSPGNLNFNCLLMLAPEEILDYVIVHELAHRREMNHSKSFWALVEGVMPDYKERRDWLKANGGAIMARFFR